MLSLAAASLLLAQSTSSFRAHDEERSDERRRAKNHFGPKYY
jgi:hypothetical protein